VPNARRQKCSHAAARALRVLLLRLLLLLLRLRQRRLRQGVPLLQAYSVGFLCAVPLRPELGPLCRQKRCHAPAVLLTLLLLLRALALAAERREAVFDGAVAGETPLVRQQPLLVCVCVQRVSSLAIAESTDITEITASTWGPCCSEASSDSILVCCGLSLLSSYSWLTAVSCACASNLSNLSTLVTTSVHRK
jgi:hypothetical protein